MIRQNTERFSKARSLLVYSATDAALAARLALTLQAVQGDGWSQTLCLQDDAETLPLIARRADFIFMLISRSAVADFGMQPWPATRFGHAEVIDLMVDEVKAWPLRAARLDLSSHGAVPADAESILHLWLVAELGPAVSSSSTRGILSPLGGISRRELAEIATACITEEKLLDLLFELDTELEDLEGGTHHARLLHLMASLKREGQLRQLIDFIAASCLRCAERRLKSLRGSHPWDHPPAAVLRDILAVCLRTEDEFDAFCLDFFREVYALFCSSMNRVRRTNLLLAGIDPLDVLERLRGQFPAVVARYSQQLALPVREAQT